MRAHFGVHSHRMHPYGLELVKLTSVIGASENLVNGVCEVGGSATDKMGVPRGARMEWLGN